MSIAGNVSMQKPRISSSKLAISRKLVWSTLIDAINRASWLALPSDMKMCKAPRTRR